MVKIELTINNILFIGITLFLLLIFLLIVVGPYIFENQVISIQTQCYDNEHNIIEGLTCKHEIRCYKDNLIMPIIIDNSKCPKELK